MAKKKKLYGAALAAQQKKLKSEGGSKRKVKKDALLGTGMDAAERAYWAEYKRQNPAAKASKKEEDLSPYPTPEVLHREMTYQRPLTPAQKRVQKTYYQWLKNKPKDPDGPPPMTAAQKKTAAFKVAYERWESRRPRAAIYALPAGSR